MNTASHILLKRLFVLPMLHQVFLNDKHSSPLSRTGIALFSWCVVACNGAFGVYLPEVGPAPLRFHSLPAFVATASMLPPLNLVEPLAATKDEAAEPVASSATESAPADPAGLPPASFVAEKGDPDVVETDAVQSPGAPAVPVITPQMLVQFFRPGGTNTNVGTSVIVPGAFLPPQGSPAAASSSANFQIK